MIGSNSSEDPGIHLLVGFNGVSVDTELKQIIKDFKVGGIVLFRRNLEAPAQVQGLVAEAQELARSFLGRPLLVAIDQEGGPVQRLKPPFTQLPSARELSREGPEAVRTWAAVAAREMRQIGVNVNFAPVLDLVAEGEEHFMTARTLGDDPESVSRLGNTWIEALQSNAVSATAKHFPGLGTAESDPHHFAPVIRWKDAREMEKHLAPFRRAVTGGVDGIMTSHARYPLLDSEWPATLSPRINRVLLRREMGFGGMLYSDDMDMAAVSERHSRTEMVRQGILASIDFFLACQRSENIGKIHEALAREVSGDSSLQAMERESLRRIERMLARHFSGHTR